MGACRPRRGPKGRSFAGSDALPKAHWRCSDPSRRSPGRTLWRAGGSAHVNRRGMSRQSRRQGEQSLVRRIIFDGSERHDMASRQPIGPWRSAELVPSVWRRAPATPVANASGGGNSAPLVVCIEAAEQGKPRPRERSRRTQSGERATRNPRPRLRTRPPAARGRRRATQPYRRSSSTSAKPCSRDSPRRSPSSPSPRRLPPPVRSLPRGRRPRERHRAEGCPCGSASVRRRRCRKL